MDISASARRCVRPRISPEALALDGVDSGVARSCAQFTRTTEAVTMYQIMVALTEWADGDLPFVPCTDSRGDRVPPTWPRPVRRRAALFRLPTTPPKTGLSMTSKQSRAAAERQTSIGDRMPYASVRMVDEGGDDVSSTEAGENRLSGSALTPGYREMSRATLVLEKIPHNANGKVDSKEHLPTRLTPAQDAG